MSCPIGQNLDNCPECGAQVYFHGDWPDPCGTPGCSNNYDFIRCQVGACRAARFLLDRRGEITLLRCRAVRVDQCNVCLDEAYDLN